MFIPSVTRAGKRLKISTRFPWNAASADTMGHGRLQKSRLHGLTRPGVERGEENEGRRRGSFLLSRFSGVE